MLVEHRAGGVCVAEVSWTLIWRVDSHSSSTDRLVGRPSLGWRDAYLVVDLYEGGTRTHSSRLVLRFRDAARRLGCWEGMGVGVEWCSGDCGESVVLVVGSVDVLASGQNWLARPQGAG